MAGTTISVKRQWGISSTLNAIRAFYTEHNDVITDLETLRAPLAQSNILIEELHDDHAIQKTHSDAVELLIEELHDDSGTTATWDTEVDGDFDLINNLLFKEFQRDGVISGGNIVGGSVTTSKIKLGGTVNFRIGGVAYSATDVEAVLISTDDITQAKYGAWRVMIDKKGVLSTQRATANGSSGVMAFTAEEDALLSLAQVARTANTVDVGYVAILAASGGFTPQTDLPIIGDAQVDGINYYSVTQPAIDNGLTAALSASVAIGITATKYSVGTIDARTNGKEPTQIGASTDVTFDDADTIADTQFGGWLILTNLAGTGLYSLASDGIADAVSAMTHASDAAVVTQLDIIRLALPLVFTEVGHIRIQNAVGADPTTFTAATTALDGSEADISVIYVDRLSGNFDRTSLTLALAQSGVEVIPSAIAAPLTPGVGSSKPASGPDTLNAGKPTSSGVNAASDLIASSISTIESQD